jgi:hypothetical protein
LIAEEMGRLAALLGQIFGAGEGAVLEPPAVRAARDPNSPDRSNHESPPGPLAAAPTPPPPELTVPPEVRAALLSIGLVDPGSPKSLRTYIRTMIREQHPDQLPEAQREVASRRIQQISAAQRVLRRYNLLD